MNFGTLGDTAFTELVGHVCMEWNRKNTSLGAGAGEGVGSGVGVVNESIGTNTRITGKTDIGGIGGIEGEESGARLPVPPYTPAHIQNYKAEIATIAGAEFNDYFFDAYTDMRCTVYFTILYTTIYQYIPVYTSIYQYTL